MPVPRMPWRRDPSRAGVCHVCGSVVQSNARSGDSGVLLALQSESGSGCPHKFNFWGLMMKVATFIARILVGLVFVVFGSNAFLNFIHAPLPTGLAGEFFTVLFQSHYVFFVGGIQVLGGALLLANRYVPLGITLLGPVIFNILLYHLLLDHTGGSVAVVVAILWGILFYRYRQNFASLFVQKAA